MPPKLNRLQHIALKVRDMEKSLRFYVDVLGFSVVEGLNHDDPGRSSYGYASRMRFISCTNEHHVINLTEIAPDCAPENPPPPENSRARTDYGLHHFAFEVDGKEAFDEWVAHLRSKGVEFVKGPMLHSPTHPEGDGSPGENRAVYFCDPDGNAVEICCDIMQLDENGEVDRGWHADRLRRDGYDPEKVSIPLIQKVSL